MKSAQFIKGMINGVEVEYTTQNLMEVVGSAQELAPMWDQKYLGTFPRIRSQQRYTALTVVTKSEPDEFGRYGIVNRTVIYQFEPSKTENRVKYGFDAEDFRQKAHQGYFNFKMPPMPELKKPLDLPPEPEWEVNI
jgi:hypothetical protein